MNMIIPLILLVLFLIFIFPWHYNFGGEPITLYDDIKVAFEIYRKDKR